MSAHARRIRRRKRTERLVLRLAGHAPNMSHMKFLHVFAIWQTWFEGGDWRGDLNTISCLNCGH